MPPARLRYAVRPSALGVVLIAAQDEAIVAVSLGDDVQDCLADLRRRGLHAAAGDDDTLQAWMDAVVRAVDDPSSSPDLPLAPAGTPFQRRVWELLRAIPVGETTTYTALAARLGDPRLARAVGTAVGANPVAVLIPCHRVLRADGGLAGYRWGLERKRALLDRESGSRAPLSLPFGGSTAR